MTTASSKDIATLLATEQRASWPRRSIRWAAVLIVAAIVAAIGLRLAGSNAAATAPSYVTSAVTRADLDVRVAATGSLQPTNTVQVGSELSGLIEAVLVDDNDSVKRGQVLARLDTSKLLDQITRSEAALAVAEAKLAQSEATVTESAANMERLQEVSRLSGGRVPSKTEMETAEATLARARAERASAQAAVTDARATLNSDRTNLSKASIRSPIDGVVLSRSVEPGQTVAASLQVATLFTIAEDLRQMELSVNVDEADVGRVKEGQRASFTVDAYPARTYTADVVRVAYGSTTTADVVSYAALLKVRNDDLSLRPGMTASAEIQTALVTDALVVPNAALRFTPPTADTASNASFVSRLMPGPPRGGTAQQQRSTSSDAARQVWVLQDGVPLAVAVAVGQSDGTQTEITSGDLREGMQVITDTSSGAQS